jgi:hypothetical protein
MVGRRRQPVPATPDWRQVADGKPWRLRRGRDYDADVQTLTAAARAAAVELGRPVRVAKDKFEPDRALWVQFADAAIGPDEPCVCGSRTLRSLHRNFLDCPSCGRLLLIDEDQAIALERHVTADPAAPERPAPAPRLRQTQKVLPTEPLSSYAELRIRAYDLLEIGRRAVAVAVDPDGNEVLLVLWEPFADGKPVPDPLSPTGHEAKLLAVVPRDAVSTLLGDAAAEADQAEDLVSERT